MMSGGVVEVVTCVGEAQPLLVSNINPKVAMQTWEPARVGETKEGLVDRAGSCRYGGMIVVASYTGLIGKLRKIPRTAHVGSREETWSLAHVQILVGAASSGPE